MARSDTDECYEVPCYTDARMMTVELDDSVLDKSNDTTIHSGHFMVSCVHTEPEEGDSSPKPESVTQRIGNAFDFETAQKEPTSDYNFGPKSVHTLAIEASLTKLFDCLTLAYRSEISLIC